ncbi:MAG: hypothetical protein WC734_00335 [Patescibacteria group bacterium]|jgi:hypothetical protein
MPKYVTEGRLEGIMAEFTDQFRDFVAHFNKGQGVITHWLRKHDERFEEMEVHFDEIETKLEAIMDMTAGLRK